MAPCYLSVVFLLTDKTAAVADCPLPSVKYDSSITRQIKVFPRHDGIPESSVTEVVFLLCSCVFFSRSNEEQSETQNKNSHSYVLHRERRSVAVHPWTTVLITDCCRWKGKFAAFLPALQQFALHLIVMALFH